MLVPETEIIISRDGNELGRTTVRPGDYVIGCDAAAEIRIEAEGVEGRHAQLTVNYHELFIEDLGSGSGTFVGGQPITEATRLWPTQKVRIGSVVLETRKVKSMVDSSVSLAPDAATVRRVLPEEFLRQRKYEIGGLLAQGGMGAILDAHEATTQRKVAMKVMLSHMSEGDVLRFIEEAQITSQLEHPNIVPVHELGVDEHDQVFYTMKLVQGVSLRQVMEKLRAGNAATVAAYPLRRLLMVLLRVCDAMAFAHSRRVIHRDLKPDNVMIGDFGEVLVMDWGLAKVMGKTRATVVPASPNGGASDSAVRRFASLSGSVRSVRQEETGSLTMAGSIVGTPHYMSPEQANGETDSLDEGCDIWALGAILRHILTLEKPVIGETVDEVIENVRTGRLAAIPPRAAHCPGGRVPEALIAVAAKAQALDREDRYASVAQFREEIDAYLGGFATKAEQAGFAKQLLLLVQRHKGIFFTAITAWLLLTALAVWFVLNLRAKEQRASTGEKKAVAAEAVATAEKETARQALAKSQLDLAEKEFERGKFVEAQKILDETPESFRDSNWRFLQAHSRDFTAEFSIPGQGGVNRLLALPGGDRYAARCIGAIGIFTFKGERIGNWIPSTGQYQVSYGVDRAGATMAFSGSANEIAVQDLATDRLVQRWTSEISDITQVLLSPDGGTVLAAGGKQLIAYDAKTGAPLWRQPYAGVVPAFSPDGRTVATLPERKGLELKIQLLDTLTGVARSTIEATADNPIKWFLQFNQTGDRLACLGDDEVILWNARTGAKIRALHFPGEAAKVISPGGDAVATLNGGRIRLWDTTTGRLLRSLNGAGTWVRDLVFSSDGTMVLSSHLSGMDGVVHFWPTRLGEAIITGKAESGGGRVVFDRDGSRIYAEGHNVEAREIRSGVQKWKYNTEPRRWVLDLAIHPTDGSIVLSEFRNRTFTHFSSAGETLETFGANAFSSLKFNRSGQLLLAVAYPNDPDDPGREFSVMEYPSGKVLRTIPLENPRQPLAAFCLDDAAVATAALSGGLVVWDWKAGMPLRRIAAAQTGSIACLASSTDGRHLATGGPDRWIRVWEAATGRLEAAFRAHWEGVRCVKFSADGREILSGDEDGVVRLNDASTGEEKLALYGLTSPVLDVDFSPDGALIAAITDDGYKVWDRKGSEAAALLPK